MLSTLKKQDSETYWNKFYKFQPHPHQESTFSNFVNERINNKSIVLDVGCGSGRDSFYFANNGHKVIGIDRSKEAINDNINKNLTLKQNQNVNFYQVDLKKQEELLNIITPLVNQSNSEQISLIVYLRFLLHSIDENTEEKLLNTLSNQMDTGNILAAEFRTTEDKMRTKVYDDHYRRFIDADSLIEKLQKTYSFEKVYFSKGTGLSVYKDEDPFLGRILMKKI